MQRFFKALTALLAALTIALFALGSYDHVPRSFMVPPFGLLFMSAALNIVVSRTDLWSRGVGRIPPGHPIWKAGLLVFWVIGLITAWIGAGMVLSEAGKVISPVWLAIAAIATVTGGWVIVRTGPDPRERVSAEELIRNAQVLVGYGQTARAAAILEEASKTYPFNQQLAKMLAQIRAGER
jgi:hypothetical protein